MPLGYALLEMRLPSSMKEGPDHDWGVERNGGTDIHGEWQASNSYRCRKYVKPHHWFEAYYIIGRDVVLTEHWFKLTHVMNRHNARSLRKALFWCTEQMDLALKHKSMKYFVRDAMKGDCTEHVYKVEGRVLLPVASVFHQIESTFEQIYGITSWMGHKEDGWPAGEYFAVRTNGTIGHISLTGHGGSMGSVRPDREAFPISTRLFRWSAWGMPEFCGVKYQLGTPVVCCPPEDSAIGTVAIRGLHSHIIGIPLGDSDGGPHYRLDAIETQITEKWLCTQEEWAAFALSK